MRVRTVGNSPPPKALKTSLSCGCGPSHKLTIAKAALLAACTQRRNTHHSEHTTTDARSTHTRSHRQPNKQALLAVAVAFPKINQQQLVVAAAVGDIILVTQQRPQQQQQQQADETAARAITLTGSAAPLALGQHTTTVLVALLSAVAWRCCCCFSYFVDSHNKNKNANSSSDQNEIICFGPQQYENDTYYITLPQLPALTAPTPERQARPIARHKLSSDKHDHLDPVSNQQKVPAILCNTKYYNINTVMAYRTAALQTKLSRQADHGIRTVVSVSVRPIYNRDTHTCARILALRPLAMGQRFLKIFFNPELFCLTKRYIGKREAPPNGEPKQSIDGRSQR